MLSCMQYMFSVNFPRKWYHMVSEEANKTSDKRVAGIVNKIFSLTIHSKYDQ